MADDRRKRCRELGRVDQSTGKDEEQKTDWEFIGAAGELAVAKAFNLCPDFGEEAGKADFRLPPNKFNHIFDYNTLDVKTVNHDSRGKNLLVKESAAPCDVYVLVEHIGFSRYKLVGWASGEEVRNTPVGEVVDGCHFMEAGELNRYMGSLALPGQFPPPSDPFLLPRN
jgi:hypothetical protein